MTYANLTTETATNDYVAEFTSENNLKNNLITALEMHTNLNGDSNVAAAYKLPDTDLKAGRLIKQAFGDEIVFVPTSKTAGEWYVWDGTIFVKTVNDELLDDHLVNTLSDAMHDVIIRLRAAENSNPTPSDDEKSTAFDKAIHEAAKYARDIENERNNSNLRKRIRKAFQVSATHFDNDQNYIVFADGQVLDTRNPAGGLMPPSASRPVSRKMGVTLGEEGVLPTQFLKSLEDRWIAPDVQTYLQWAAGAAMLGRGDAKHIVTLVGLGGTGKSSYINSMVLAFGGYAKSISPGAIVAKSTNFEQHDARGARFLRLEEPIECKTDDSFLKNLAGGGGEVPTQQKGRDIVHWKAQCVLFIAANHIPKFNTTDDAIVSRMNLVGFNRKFNEEDGVFEKDIEVRILEEEGPAIARWILDGAIAYHNHGKATFPLAQSMKDASASNVSESSPSLRWLLEKFEDGTYEDGRTFDQDAKVSPSNMVVNSKLTYAIFADWAESDGYEKRQIPNKLKWAEEINKYMGEPVVESKKRPGGFPRLWNVVPPLDKSDLRGIKNMQTTSPIQMMEDGTGKFF